MCVFTTSSHYAILGSHVGIPKPTSPDLKSRLKRSTFSDKDPFTTTIMFNLSTVAVMTRGKQTKVTARMSTGGKRVRHQVGTTPALLSLRSSLPPTGLSSSEPSLPSWSSRRLHHSPAMMAMATRSSAPRLLEEREPAPHQKRKKETARMSTGGPAPKAQRAGDRVTKGPLRPQSPEEDMSLSSWSLSPIDGLVDPPEDGRKKSKGHDKIKAKGADIEEREPACHKKWKVAARMGKAADLVQARGADPPGRDGRRMLK
jgi:hypothetical protein